jgi:hypothetical protein
MSIEHARRFSWTATAFQAAVLLLFTAMGVVAYLDTRMGVLASLDAPTASSHSDPVEAGKP